MKGQGSGERDGRGKEGEGASGRGGILLQVLKGGIDALEHQQSTIET